MLNFVNRVRKLSRLPRNSSTPVPIIKNDSSLIIISNFSIAPCKEVTLTAKQQWRKGWNQNQVKSFGRRHCSKNDQKSWSNLAQFQLQNLPSMITISSSWKKLWPTIRRKIRFVLAVNLPRKSHNSVTKNLKTFKTFARNFWSFYEPFQVPSSETWLCFFNRASWHRA